MKKLFSILLTVVLVLSFSLVTAVPVAAATDYYVRTDGSDTNNGSANDASNAWLTIQYAIDTVQTGGTINVADGTYPENVVLPNGKSITLLGAQANVDPTVDGGRAGPESILEGWVNGSHNNADGITLSDDAVITIEINGFTIKGYEYGIRGTESGGVVGATISYNILDGNGNDGNSPNYFDIENNRGGGIRVYNMDTSTISYNVVKDGERGIRLDAASGSGSDGNTVSYNLIHDNEQYGIAIYPGGDGNTIEHNTIYNSADRGIQLGWDITHSGNIVQYNEIYDINNDGILITNATNFTITGNTIYNVAFTNQTLGRPTGGAPSPVFSLQAVHGGIALVGENSNVTITGNILHDNGEMGEGNPWGSIGGATTTTATSDGIWISGSSTATVHGNSIYDNNEYGLENENTGVTTDAENNWWGSANGPEHAGNTFNVVAQGDKVSDNVDYVPWYDTDMTGTSFAPVNNSAEGTEFSSIQSAIDAASAGNTISVAAGTYEEVVTIDKSLTLTGDPGDSAAGPGPNAPILDGNGVVGSAITIAGGVSDVTIEGFEIRNYRNRTFGSTGTTGGIGSAILAWNSSAINNVIIRDNDMHDLGWSAVLVGNEGQVLHDNWLVENNVVTDWATYAIELTNTQNSSVIGNEITGGNVILGESGDNSENAILIQAQQLAQGAGLTVTTVTVDDNTINGPLTRAGIEILAWDSTGSLTAVADNIIVSNNRVGGAERGIYVFSVGNSANINNLSINGNALDGNVAGLHIRDFSGGTHSSINITENDITNSTDTAVAIVSGTSASGIAVNYNNMEGNAYGIKNNTGMLDAKYNWWGKVNGPYHTTANPGVVAYMGDSVSENVDFSPWLYKNWETIVPTKEPAYAQSVVLDNYGAYGWNTFSTPIFLDDSADTWADLVTLTGLDYIIAYRYDSASQDFVLLTDPDSSDYVITPGEGFFIKMNSAGSLPILYSTADNLAPPSRTLTVDWNLVGLASLENIEASIAFFSLAGEGQVVSPTGNVEPGAVLASDTVYVGEAYWAYMLSEKTLVGFTTTPVNWVP